MTAGAILVVLTRPDTADGCLHIAAQAARALPEAPIDVLHALPDPAGTILPSAEVLPSAPRADIEQRETTTATELRAIYDVWRAGVPRAVWHAIAGIPADEVRRRARAAAPIQAADPTPTPCFRRRSTPGPAVW